MSKFDLRDVSARLASSRSSEAVVAEFLAFLESGRSDWRAALAFYEVSGDALVRVYERDGQKSVRRDIVVPLDRLPPRLVRKFFHRIANSNGPLHEASGTPDEDLVGTLCYFPDPREAPDLQPLTPFWEWQSCVCLPLTDGEDVVALLTIVSKKKNAFHGKALSEIVPVIGMASLALSQHLYRHKRKHEQDDERRLSAEVEQFRDRLESLNAQAQHLQAEN
jgi:hypothetical protein